MIIKKEKEKENNKNESDDDESEEEIKKKKKKKKKDESDENIIMKFEEKITKFIYDYIKNSNILIPESIKKYLII